MRNFCITMCLISFLSLGGCGGDKPLKRPVPLVEVMTVEKTALKGRSDVYSASVEPYSRVQLSFRGQGYVASIHKVQGPDGSSHIADPGDWVPSGTVLATLRAEDFENRVNTAVSTYDRSVAAVKQAQSQHFQACAAVDTARAVAKQARASVQMAEAGEAQAKAQVDAAKAEFERYRLNFERAVNLLAADSMTKSDYDAARAGNDTAKARFDLAQEQLRAAGSRVTEARAAYRAACSRIREAEGSAGMAAANVDGSKAATAGSKAQVDQARLDYADAYLKAPMSGVILSRNVEAGNQVAPGVTAFEMADIGWVRITFGVPDLVVNRLRLGQAVDVTCDAVPGKTYTGSIMTLSAGADPRDRTFRVAVKVRNADRKLKAGMIASLRLPTGDDRTTADAITVPLAALARDPLKPQEFSVFVVEGSGKSFKARLRQVKTGEAIGNSIIVTSGLTPGERVITAGASVVKDGDTVSIGE